MGGIYDRRRLARKIDWEGGIEEALRYGVRSTEIEDPELREIWAELEQVFAHTWKPLVDRVDALLPDFY